MNEFAPSSIPKIVHIVEVVVDNSSVISTVYSLGP